MFLYPDSQPVTTKGGESALIETFCHTGLGSLGVFFGAYDKQFGSLSCCFK